MEPQTEKTTILQKVYAKSSDVVDSTMEVVASWQIGQSLFKYTDRALWILEKSAEWSIPVPNTPTTEPDANGTFGKPGPLVRPLPWVLFLPVLLILRLVRMSLNLGAIFIGMDSVKPTTMVRFIQIRRRRIRALRFRGLRRMVQRKSSTQSDSDKVSSWRDRVYKTLAGVVCINYSHNDISERIVARENSAEILFPVNTDHKRKYDDVDTEEADDENLSEFINKLAEQDSDEDPEYIPIDTQSDDDSASEGEDEAVCKVKPNVKRLSSHSSITNEVIEEENEDSDTSTVSVESNDTKKSKETADKSPNKDITKQSETVNNVPESVTSDEYYSPQNSICPSPEPKKEPNFNITKTDLSELKHVDPKVSSEKIIASEQTTDCY